METKTLDNIKDVFNEYKHKQCDHVFFKKVIEICNHDPLISGYINPIYSNTNKCLSFEARGNNLNADLNYYSKDVSRYISQWTETYKDKYMEIYNYRYLQFILHEVEHAMQNLYAINKVSKYPEINELYDLISNAFNETGLLGVLRYNLKGKYFCFERNANVVSTDELVYICEDEILKGIAKIEYVFELLNGYDIKRKKFVNPVNETLKMLGVKDEYNVEYANIPFSERIKHGLSIDPIDYYTLIDAIGDRDLLSEDYDVIKNLINKLGSEEHARNSRS